MGSLSKEDKDIILDFYFRCGDEETINRGRDLVASNPEAAILYARLEETLTQLDSIKYEPCPDNLVELTVAAEAGRFVGPDAIGGLARAGTAKGRGPRRVRDRADRNRRRRRGRSDILKMGV